MVMAARRRSPERYAEGKPPPAWRLWRSAAAAGAFVAFAG
jgi:hypothetical protein